MVDIKPERSPEQSDKVEFDQADLAKSVPIVHSLTLLDFLQVHCGLVNIIYVGLMLPPIVPMWCQPNGDIYITKLSHWTPNSEHGSAAFFWPGTTSAQNKLASTDRSQSELASGDQTHFILQLSPPILGWDVEIFLFPILSVKYDCSYGCDGPYRRAYSHHGVLGLSEQV